MQIDPVKDLGKVVDALEDNTRTPHFEMEAAPILCGREAQAVVVLDGVRYCMSLEPLP